MVGIRAKNAEENRQVMSIRSEYLVIIHTDKGGFEDEVMPLPGLGDKRDSSVAEYRTREKWYGGGRLIASPIDGVSLSSEGT